MNVYDVLYNYGFDDLYIMDKVISVDWSLLINRLKNKLKEFTNFSLHTNSTVLNVKYNDNFIVTTNIRDYHSINIISGTDINSFNKIFINLPKSVLQPYKLIQGQPFLLLYAKFSKASTLILNQYIKNFTIYSSRLHKIIPINPNDGIYIISYSDNNNAIKLKSYLSNKTYLIDLIKKTLNIKDDLKILKLHSYYWINGTHYYKPFLHLYTRRNFLNRIRYPIKNLYIIGEMVAEKQGWINGALETTLKIIKKFHAYANINYSK